jgi:hypothetical protein
MPAYDSQDLLALFNSRAARPTAGTGADAITDVQKYARLAKAQQRVIAMLSAVAPSSLYPKVAYGALPKLTTTDNQVFTFATFPMGHGGIYPTLASIPDSPWREGVDYLNEGTQIRIPNNGTYTGPLYWYGVAQPADISASVQPALVPPAACELIVIEAVRQFAREGVRNGALVDEMQDEWDRTWPQWCLVWKTQFRHGGALAAVTVRDMALANQW